MKVIVPCPVETTLNLLSNKWRILIIRELLTGKKRFNELRKTLNITQRSLTLNLKSMEKHNIIIKKTFQEIPPHTEYYLSPVGETLKPIIEALKEWGEWYKKNNVNNL